MKKTMQRLLGILLAAALSLSFFAACSGEPGQEGGGASGLGVQTACGHSWITLSETQPTCTVRGHRLEVCVLCAETRDTSFGSALGHDYGAWQTEREASCGESSLNVRTCSRCGHRNTNTVFTQHRYEQTSVYTPGESDCLVQGYTEYTCSECGDVYRAYTDVAGHTPLAGADTVVQPTCIAGGYTQHTCSKCGTKYVGDSTEALGHDYHTEAATEATCSSIGGARQVCTRCGYSTYSQVVSKLPHNFDAEGYCSGCGKHVTEAAVLESDSANAYVRQDEEYGNIVYAPDGTEIHYVKIGREVIDALIAQGYRTITVSFGSHDEYRRAFAYLLPGETTEHSVGCWGGYRFAAPTTELTLNIADENGNVNTGIITENGFRMRMVYRDANGAGNSDRGKGSLSSYAMRQEYSHIYSEEDRTTWFVKNAGISFEESGGNYVWTIPLAVNYPAYPVILRAEAVRCLAEQDVQSLRFTVTPKAGQQANFAVNGGGAAFEAALTGSALEEGVVISIAMGSVTSALPDGFVLTAVPIYGSGGGGA